VRLVSGGATGIAGFGGSGLECRPVPECIGEAVYCSNW
jgi:hypothetical protein